MKIPLKKIKLEEIITVKPKKDKKLPYPLKLSFSRNEDISKETKCDLTGPGIYLILFGDEVIYLGKYQPVRGDILGVRWLRHMQTLTIRGSQVGFRSKKLNYLLRQVTNQNLCTALKRLHKNHRKEHFIDTGVVTSQNRIGFANENWDTFRQQNDNAILGNFSIVLLRLTNLSSEKEKNRNIIVSAIERSTLKCVRPRCNGRGMGMLSPERRECIRSKNTIKKVIEHARKAAKANGTKFTHCTSLIGANLYKKRSFIGNLKNALL